MDKKSGESRRVAKNQKGLRLHKGQVPWVIVFLMAAIFLYSRQQETAQGIRYHLEGSAVTKVASDSHGRIWILSPQLGIQYLDDEEWVSLPTPPEAYRESTLYGSEVVLDENSEFFIDPKDNIWLTTESGDAFGIFFFDGTQWTQFTEDNSGLVDNQIHEIVFDAEGRAWIANYWGPSLSSFDGNQWQTFADLEGRIRIAADPQGRLWVVTEEEVIKDFGGARSSFRPGISIAPYGLLSDSTVFDSSGAVWILTYNEILSFDGGEWSSLALPEDSWTIFIDREDRIWSLPRNGLVHVFDQGEWTQVASSKGSRLDYISGSAAQDGDGNIWLASQFEDLTSIQPDAHSSTSELVIAIRTFLASGGLWYLEILLVCLLFAARKDRFLPAAAVTASGLFIFGLFVVLFMENTNLWFHSFNPSFMATGFGLVGVFASKNRTRVRRWTAVGFGVGLVIGLIPLTFGLLFAYALGAAYR